MLTLMGSVSMAGTKVSTSATARILLEAHPHAAYTGVELLVNVASFCQLK